MPESCIDSECPHSRHCSSNINRKGENQKPWLKSATWYLNEWFDVLLELHCLSFHERQIKTEEHAHAMNAKLAQKSGSSQASSFHTPSILNLASRTTLGRVDMSLVHDDIVAERIFKSFCIAHATEPRALLFETDWRGARSLIPRLLDNSFAFTIKYRSVQSTSTTPVSAFHEQVQELLRTETLPSGLELGEPRLLLQQTDSSTLLQPDEWQQVLQVCAEADTEAGWYLSFVASFPSDYAFDDISMAFIKQ
jgi:hypothetical protein